MEKSFTTRELVDRLLENLRTLGGEGGHAYTVGYLSTVLVSIVEGGVDELVEHVDWTNQRVEAKAKGVA